MTMCGGIGSAHPIDDDAKAAFNAVSAKFLEQTGLTGNVDLVSYRSQVVAGINYFILVRTESSTYELTIWRKLDKTFELTNVKHL